MMDKYTYRWTIDDVLDPNSAFWKKMYSDIKEKPETGLESIERDMWKDRIGEFLAYFKQNSIKETEDVKSIKDTEFLIVDVLWGLVSEEDKDKLEANKIWCDKVLLSWNLVDDKGDVIPANAESALMVAPSRLLAVLITKWAELVTEPSANLSNTQNDMPTLETLANQSTLN